MYKFLLTLGVSSAAVTTSQSQPTSKTLISDGTTKLMYSYYTKLTIDSDENKVFTL